MDDGNGNRNVPAVMCPPSYAIRHLTTDVKTLSYIENVLQTRVKGSSSADRSWQKLRNGMYVVRTMAKDAAGGEAEVKTVILLNSPPLMCSRRFRVCSFAHRSIEMSAR